MIVDLVRHASTGRRGHLDGASDVPLLAGAADALARRYAGRAWSRVVASPLRRALDTAHALAGTRPVQVNPRWRELDFGAWDGAASGAVPADVLARFHANPVADPFPGAEPWAGFQARIGTALQALAEADAGPGAGAVLVVSHAGAMRMALQCACGWGLAQCWSLRLEYGTRLRLRVERDAGGALWGEVLELEQP